MTTGQRDIQALLTPGLLSILIGMAGTWMWHTQVRQELSDDRQARLELSHAESQGKQTEISRQLLEIVKDHEGRIQRLEQRQYNGRLPQ